jgi:hypothetical protein
MAAAGMNFKRMMNLWQSGQNILAQFIFALILDFCIHNKDNPKTQNLIITF